VSNPPALTDFMVAAVTPALEGRNVYIDSRKRILATNERE
jgi:hypothetical protein